MGRKLKRKKLNQKLERFDRLVQEETGKVQKSIQALKTNLRESENSESSGSELELPIQGLRGETTFQF